MEKAIDQIETEPKYSVINFYTAIELIFKARLLNYNWKYIFTNEKKANMDNFRNGNFHSVSIDTCLCRLVDNCKDDTVQKGELEINYPAIKTLKDHRNLCVHFYNTKKTQEHINNIRLEQYNAWVVIRDLIKEAWSDDFKKFECNFKLLNSRIECPEFWEVKHKSPTLKKNLKQARDNNSKISKCQMYCKYDDTWIIPNFSPVKNEINKLHEECLLCEVTKKRIGYFCNSCKKFIKFTDLNNNLQCPHCENTKVYEKNVLLNLFGLQHVSTEIIRDYNKVQCYNCNSKNIISDNGYNYICLNCGEKSERGNGVYYYSPEL